MAQDRDGETPKPDEKSYWTTVFPITLFTSILLAAKDIYFAAKEAGPIQKYVGDKIESFGRRGYNFIVQPVVENSTVQKCLKYVDNKLNEGVYGVEARVNRIQQAKKSVETAVQESVNKKVNAVKTTADNIVQRIHVLLTTSLLARPYKFSLYVIENFIQRPIVTVVTTTKQVVQQIKDKIKQISLKSPDSINPWQYTVNFIHSLNVAIASGIAKAQQGVAAVGKGVLYVVQIPKRAFVYSYNKIQVGVNYTLEVGKKIANFFGSFIPNFIVVRYQKLVDLGQGIAQAFANLKQSIKQRFDRIDFTPFQKIGEKLGLIGERLAIIVLRYMRKLKKVPLQLTYAISDGLYALRQRLYQNTSTRGH